LFLLSICNTNIKKRINLDNELKNELPGIAKRAPAKKIIATSADLNKEYLRTILLVTRLERFRFLLATYIYNSSKEEPIKKRFRQ
jgi:hypothetical protein